jgi:SAM-dependent methyltransferase
MLEIQYCFQPLPIDGHYTQNTPSSGEFSLSPRNQRKPKAPRSRNHQPRFSVSLVVRSPVTEVAMSETGQVTQSAAEIYDKLFLPALFDEWVPRVVEAARLEPGMRVLDVACGTGVLSLAAYEAVAPNGSVTGLDLNSGMLRVAKQKAPQIEWHEGPAEALPFEDASFDAVISQFGLMFFQDQVGAIREMARVLRPGGHLAVAVWDSFEHIKGYAAAAEILADMFGDAAAESVRAPYSLGDKQILSPLFSEAGIADFSITTHDGTARYPSIRYWMEADIKGWTLSDKLSDDEFEALVRRAESDLSQFVNADGTVEFNSPAHIVTASKAAS